MLLIIGGKIKNSVKDFKTFTEVFQYHFLNILKKNQIKYLFVNIYDFDSSSLNSWNEYFLKNNLLKYEVKKIVAIQNRFFQLNKINLNGYFKDKFNGVKTIQFYEGSLLDKGGCDLTLTFRKDDFIWSPGILSDPSRHDLFNFYVGWATDKELFTPKKIKKQLNIFIDHSAFNETQKDNTLEILMNIRSLQLNKNILKNLI